MSLTATQTREEAPYLLGVFFSPKLSVERRFRRMATSQVWGKIYRILLLQQHQIVFVSAAGEKLKTDASVPGFSLQKIVPPQKRYRKSHANPGRSQFSGLHGQLLPS